MLVYRGSSMTVYSGSDSWDHACEVRISEGSLALSYSDEGKLVVYKGREEEPGHFRLVADGVSGKATLHRFYEDDVLEGWWLEAGEQGMWRVTLDE